MNCLICHQPILPKIGWTYLFSKEKPQYLCDVCESSFTKIQGETCRKCDRPLACLEFKEAGRCYDCIRWEEDPVWAGSLQKNHSTVLYNDFCKEVIAKYKFRGDYILANALAAIAAPTLKKIKYDLIAPIPLSDERLYERGFNQSEAIITSLGLEPAHLLQRTHTEKQSKKSRAERIQYQQVFQIASRDQIPGKTILLLDDIYTTGSTLHQAAKLLKTAGAKEVYSLTFARG